MIKKTIMKEHDGQCSYAAALKNRKNVISLYAVYIHNMLDKI